MSKLKRGNNQKVNLSRVLLLGEATGQRLVQVPELLSKIQTIVFNYSYIDVASNSKSSTRGLPTKAELLANVGASLLDLSYSSIDVAALEQLFKILCDLAHPVTLHFNYCVVGDQAAQLISSYIWRIENRLQQFASIGGVDELVVEMKYAHLSSASHKLLLGQSVSVRHCAINLDHSRGGDKTYLDLANAPPSADTVVPVQVSNMNGQQVLPSAPAYTMINEFSDISEAIAVHSVPAMPDENDRSKFEAPLEASYASPAVAPHPTTVPMETPPVNTVCYEGWLYKLPVSPFFYDFLYTWKKRLFVLGFIGNTVYIDYYTDVNKRNKRGTMLLNGYSVLDTGKNQLTLSKATQSVQGTKKVFHSLVLRFQNASELAIWRDVIRQIIASKSRDVHGFQY